MRHCQTLLSLTSILTSLSAVVIAQTPQPPPTFEALFAGQLINGDLKDTVNTTGPFGTRIHSPITGGNLTDANTGDVVATLLPTADNGIVTSSGLFFSSSVLPYVWKVDGTLASITVHGIGNSSTGSFAYAHVETDSSTYSWMNSNFFIIRLVTTANPLVPEFTLYGVSNTTQ
ncbi:hypothetical protein BD309DRAFT_987032 [Dichomitus squalens]|uniref:Uncharacterized protein n=2 Tax=Dichomitus squalens TaxID=114155 RepID=A0A4Q9P350_9APHY|nr:uncharacterized protein DICSQDRAFT_171512 [Dichomitus squalens LYAD-421 SS1]EJF60024.1 hypothetical protein DICSQDRAFT_171512 [Dichomitus squalens LYAD-421 SS1]TBU29190.1 hypothetical protein BD311DRAFT_661677 [Dichomitus squalens]TBU48769.1 hypothetical protein BD309DRAFT_987032 [Dichomitus squalens]TBU57821.1 hypothetical protein BD310DRAFT_820789 [Dichomitus squalens]